VFTNGGVHLNAGELVSSLRTLSIPGARACKLIPS